MNSIINFLRRERYFLLFFIISFVVIFGLRVYLYTLQAQHVHLKKLLIMLSMGTLQDIFIPFCLYTLSKLKFKKILSLFSIICTIFIIAYNIAISTVFYHTKSIFSYDFVLQISEATILYIMANKVIILLFLGLFIILISILFALKKNFSDLNSEKCDILIIVFLLIPMACSILTYQNTKNTKLYKNYSSYEYVARPIYEHLMDFYKDYKYIEDNSSKEAIVKLNDDSLASHLKYNMISEKKYSKTMKYDNIIFIPLESFDLDFIHHYNTAIPECVTKNLDQFAKNYVSFSTFFTADQPTPYGLHALFASRIGYMYDLGKEVPSIFSELKKNGYVTTIVSGATGLYGKKKQTFEKMYSPDNAFFSEHLGEINNEKYSGWGADLETLFNFTYDILQKNTKNFITIENIDTHPGYNALLDESDACYKNQKVAQSRFLNTIAYVDRTLAQFVEKIFSSSHLAHNTLLIITSDHSATHGDNYTNRKDFSPTKIPLLLIANNADELKEMFDTTKYASQIDFAPTLLKLLNYEVPKSFMGNDFINKNNNAISILRPNKIRVNAPNSIQTHPLHVDNVFAKWFWSYHKE